MKETTQRLIEKFFKEHPEMSYLFDRACLAVEKMAGVYLPNKIMTCGNGGSFSDSGHIVGELMKSFLKKRPAALSDEDEAVFGKLEGAVPALCLGESSPLATAVLNDIGGEWIFAQQVFGLGLRGRRAHRAFHFGQLGGAFCAPCASQKERASLPSR